MSRIVSVWLPAWPIERMQRQVPGSVPAAEPFALVQKGAHGLRISAANGPAIAAGAVIGAALADARAALPGLAVRPADPVSDALALRKLARWLGRYGPAHNADGVDGAWVDVTGVAHLYGGERALAEDLGGRLRRMGLDARIGLADTFGAAHALARFGPLAIASGRGSLAPPGGVRSALAGLPVAALRIEHDAMRLLVRLGLKRIGQIYDLPRPALAARFREATGGGSRRFRETAAAGVLLRLDQALGVVGEPKKPLALPPEAQCRLIFPDPLGTSDGIVGALGQLASMLEARLASQGLGARRFRLVLYRTDGTAAEVVIGTSAARREPAHICRLMGEHLGRIDAGFGIDAAVLEADGLEPMHALQIGLGAKNMRGDIAGGEAEGLAALVDRLSNRLGPARVLRCVRRESHIPERSEVWLPAMDSRTSSTLTGARAPLPALVPALPPRPAFLLGRPEIISVLAGVPEGAPQRFVWRRVARRIMRSEGPERIAPEWWRHIGMTDRLPGTRDYYRLEDATGARYWVFREGFYGQSEDRADADGDGRGGEPRWFVHGVFA